MNQTTYLFSCNNDFGAYELNLSFLHKEIVNSPISRNLFGITRNGDEISIDFEGALNRSEQGILHTLLRIPPSSNLPKSNSSLPKSISSLRSYNCPVCRRNVQGGIQVKGSEFENTVCVICLCSHKDLADLDFILTAHLDNEISNNTSIMHPVCQECLPRIS